MIKYSDKYVRNLLKIPTIPPEALRGQPYSFNIHLPMRVNSPQNSPVNLQFEDTTSHLLIFDDYDSEIVLIQTKISILRTIISY